MPLKLIWTVTIMVMLCSCARRKEIEGSWKATDSTVFNFRSDGTFVGRDYVGALVWGNWVDLGDHKFGFHTLYHTSSYEPQYAVVTSPDTMKYVGAAAVIFIETKRISEAEAAKEIDAVLTALPTENAPLKN